MSLPKTQSSMNGNQKAPPEISGAFPISTGADASSKATPTRRPPTTFLPDPPASTLRSILYNLYRHEWGGGPLTRWLWVALIMLGGLWAIWFQPRWLGIVFAAGLVIILVITLAILRRGDFVRFEEEPLPPVTPEPLSPNDKVAVYATGYFSVEGQYRRFTYLPGYFRTFATREHAVLCLARDRKFLAVGRWQALDVGMWYGFCSGDLIERIRYGRLHFEKRPQPAIAIDYQLSLPANGRLRGEKTLGETIYLVCTNEADTHRLLADLLTDKPAVAAAAHNPETS